MGIAEAHGNGEPTGQSPPASMPKTHWFRAPARAKIVLSHPRIIWEPKTLLHPRPRPQEKTSHRSPFFPHQPFTAPTPSKGRSGPGLGTKSLLLRQGGLCMAPLHAQA